MNPALLAALILVESGGDPSAIGDNGRAVGILQITEACVMDVNWIYRTNYRWPKDCLDPAVSEMICMRYLIHYAGWTATDEKLARIWNGGPNGHKKASTLQYWKKVNQQLEKSK